MTRDISASAQTHVAGETIRWARFLQLDLDSGTVYLWSGQGIVSSGGNDYLGVGAMGSISGVAEDVALTDYDIEATLSNIDTSFLPELIEEFTTNDPTLRDFTLSIGFFNDDMTLDVLETLTKGWIDRVVFQESEEGGSVTIMLATRARLLRRKVFKRMSCEDQKALFPGDTSLCKTKDGGLGNPKLGNKIGIGTGTGAKPPAMTIIR